MSFEKPDMDIDIRQDIREVLTKGFMAFKVSIQSV